MVTAGRRTLTTARLSSQRTGGDLTSPVEVVRWMLAMQAQDYSGAKWSIGIRCPTATDASVEQAIAAREIVRSWPMRGTLHFVASEDLSWMLRISSARQSTWAAKRRADLGISDNELARAGELAVDRLAGGRLIRRDDLLATFEADGIPTAAQRGYHLIWNLAHSGLIVHGPVDGTQATFALLDEWVPRPRVLEGDEALGEFASRYFASHGPATERDFAWWASITLTDARIGIAIAQPESIEIDGVMYFHIGDLAPARPAVHALPGFDEYLLGYQDRSAGLDVRWANRIVPGNNGVFLPTLVVDGQIVGTWKRTARTTSVVAEIEPFTTLTARASTGFERAMRRYGRFLGRDVTVRA
ncbi:winged helix DNA-binding domain-containing protein [soil metagenome]